MKKILMLDLEGVLIATAIPKKKYVNEGLGYGVRPNAQFFVNEVCKIFDSIYLNTCAREDQALPIVKSVFNAPNIGYYDWNRASVSGKAWGYEKFKNCKLIHVEDGSPENREAKRIIQLGHTYIPIKSWSIEDAYVKKIKDDEELLKVLELIKAKI
jgi:hypothetical protein